MKLTNLLFLDGAPKLPGFRALGQGPYADWTVHVRTHAVFLVSPPGWVVNQVSRVGKQRTVYEVPRNRVLLTWDVSDGEDLKGTQQWSPEDVEILAAITAKSRPEHPQDDAAPSREADGRPERNADPSTPMPAGVRSTSHGGKR